MTDVIIFGGQSNMQGQAERLLDGNPVAGAYEYRFLPDTVVPLADPVGENIRYGGGAGWTCGEADVGRWVPEHVLGGSWCGRSTLVVPFCRSYVDATGGTVLAIHAAKGSTCIKEWLAGTDGYEMLVRKASKGIRKAEDLYGVRHVFFVWLQGESDALAAVSGAEYRERLLQLEQSLRQDLGIERFGVIRVGRFAGDSRDDRIIEAQEEVCAQNDRFLMLTRVTERLCGMPEFMNPFVPGHYSAEGLAVIGAEAGKTLGACAIV